MRLYARLRGLDEASAKKATEWGLKKLGLVAYSDRFPGLLFIVPVNKDPLSDVQEPTQVGTRGNCLQQ